MRLTDLREICYPGYPHRHRVRDLTGQQAFSKSGGTGRDNLIMMTMSDFARVLSLTGDGGFGRPQSDKM